MDRQLLWKEWTEHRWKMALGCVLLMGLAWIGLRTRVIPDEGIYAICIIIGAGLMPLFVAMGVTGTDQSENSLGFLLSLPVSSARVFKAKLLVATLVVLVPLLGSLVVCLLLSAGREFRVALLLWGYGVGIWFGLQLLIWTVAFGIRARSETGVATAGLLVVFFWALYMFVGETTIWGRAEQLFWTLTPLGLPAWLSNHDGSCPRGFRLLTFIITLSVQTATAAFLIRWSIQRLSLAYRRNS